MSKYLERFIREGLLDPCLLDHIVYESVVGSIAGMYNTEKSDYDVVAVVDVPGEYLHKIYGLDGIDLSLFNIDYYCFLLQRGMPHLTEGIFTDIKFVTHKSMFSDHIRYNRRSILSRETVCRFMKEALVAYNAAVSGSDSRTKALQSKYGYDTKHARQALQFLDYVKQIITDNDICLYSNNLKYLKIQQGIFGDVEEFKQEFSKIINDVKLSISTKELPEKGDRLWPLNT